MKTLLQFIILFFIVMTFGAIANGFIDYFHLNPRESEFVGFIDGIAYMTCYMFITKTNIDI